MNDLLQQARNVLSKSYSPYSSFKVAAALRLENGEIITGVNVENASFGLSNCAERTALFTAYTRGYRKEDIKEILVTTEKEHLVTPCGACRQVMSELMKPDAQVHLVTSNDNIKTVTVSDLLPLAFQDSDL